MSVSLHEWLDEAVRLRSQLLQLKVSRLIAPTALDMSVKIWGGLHKCIEVRRKAKGSTAQIDTALALGLLNYAAQNIPANETFVQGIRAIYRASARMEVHGDWHTLNSLESLDEFNLTQILPALEHKPCRRFVVEMTNFLKTPIPRFVISHRETSLPQGAQPNRISDVEESSEQEQAHDGIEDFQDQTCEADTTTDKATEAPRREFQRGDSILDWHSGRAKFKSRNERLALISWESLPLRTTRVLAQKLGAILRDECLDAKPAAALAVATLLTSTPPKVLLHAMLCPGSDFYIDLEDGALFWNRTRLLSNKEDPENDSPNTADLPPKPSQIARIPLPQILLVELRRLQQLRRNAKYLGDLYDACPGSPAWNTLINSVSELLKSLSDPAFPAHLGRWSNSGPQIYLNVCASDLLAAYCCLDFGLSGLSALHYFHPSGIQITQACAKVYECLGLGQPATQHFTPEKSIPSDSDLKESFALLESDMQQYARTVSGNMTLVNRVGAFNRLTQLSAATTIFCLAGRGSKVEGIKTGDLYLSKEILHLDDKQVADGRGSRLVPCPDYLKYVLDRQGHALAVIAKAIAKETPKNSGDRWRELSKGILRFEAISFQNISKLKNAYRTHPIVAADIEAVSQKYFALAKNFMRHMLITAWSIEGLDRNLLRLITGHASAGLEMPAIGAVYSPASAILEAKKPLSRLLSRWMPDVTQLPRVSFKYSFESLPVRGVLKSHKLHRNELLIGLSGPRLNRWHLAAEAVVKEVRQALLNGKGPTNAEASLWLHLSVFDGLHDEADLAAIFKNLCEAFELGGRGWTYSITSSAGNQPLHNPVQAPTAAILNSHKQLFAPDQPICNSPIEERVSDWLTTALPETWTSSPGRQSPAQCLLACTALWCDLELPSSLQYCYAPSNQAALMDRHSIRELLQLEAKFLADVPNRVDRRPISAPAAMDKLFRIINQLGDNKSRLGELKKRATLLDMEIRKMGDLTSGSWPEALTQALQQNCVLIREGRRERLEFSSLATYFSYLKPNLIALGADFPCDYTDQDWIIASKALRLVQNGGASGMQRKISSERGDAQDAATHWLLKSLCAAGYQIPAEALNRSIHLEVRPSSPTPIALITDAHVDAMLNLLSNWHRESPLDSLRANLAVRMLDGAPLRWGEASSTNALDLLDSEDFICIRPAGFSQLKSFRARRLAPILKPVRHLALELAERLFASGTLAGKEVFFFMRENNGTVDGSTADWLHTDITTALQFATGNRAAKVHAMRARAVCRLAFPGGLEKLEAWLDCSIGPAELKAYFTYEAVKAWRMEVTRCYAGHAQSRTTLAYYLYQHFQLRAMALASTLTGLRPGEAILGALGITIHALKKQGTRKASVRADPWIFVQTHAPRIEFGGVSNSVEVPKPDPVVTHDETGTSVHPEISDIKYVALRLAGCSQTHAGDVSKIRSSRGVRLENDFAGEFDGLSGLRKRIRGTPDGRAMQADLKMIASDSSTAFIQLLKRAGPECAHILLDLLSGHRRVEMWHELILTIDHHFLNSPWILECIGGSRFEDIMINQKLSTRKTLLIGPAQRDGGPQPRIYVNFSEPEKRNAVVKTRLTTMARLLCKSYCLLFPVALTNHL